MKRRLRDQTGLHGIVNAVLYRPDGTIEDRIVVPNLITDAGDAAYMRRGSGAAPLPSIPTGMQLGTSSTAAAKSGAGAAIGVYLSGTSVGFTPTWPKGSGAQPFVVEYRVEFLPGVGTSPNVREVVIHNQPLVTNSGAPAANTFSRAVFPADVNKTAGKVLLVTWEHRGEGT